MIIRYCDRCGFSSNENIKGRRVVTATFEPMSRTHELCGKCRADLNVFLSTFLRTPSVGESETARARSERTPWHDLEEAIWHLEDRGPLKPMRPDLARKFIQSFLKRAGL